MRCRPHYPRRGSACESVSASAHGQCRWILTPPARADAAQLNATPRQALDHAHALLTHSVASSRARVGRWWADRTPSRKVRSRKISGLCSGSRGCNPHVRCRQGDNGAEYSQRDDLVQNPEFARSDVAKRRTRYQQRKQGTQLLRSSLRGCDRSLRKHGCAFRCTIPSNWPRCLFVTYKRNGSAACDSCWERGIRRTPTSARSIPAP